MKQVRIAVLAANNIEDIELFVPLDIWKRAGYMVDVIVCEVRNGFNLSYSGLKVNGKLNLTAINFSMYDALFLPGGKGYKNFLVPPATAKTFGESPLSAAISQFVLKQKLLIGICASPVVFFNLIQLKYDKLQEQPQVKTAFQKFLKTRFTAYNSDAILKDLRTNWVDAQICYDNNLLTAQAAGNAFELAFAAIEKLSSKDKALEIADEINYDWSQVRANLKF